MLKVSVFWGYFARLLKHRSPGGHLAPQPSNQNLRSRSYQLYRESSVQSLPVNCLKALIYLGESMPARWSGVSEGEIIIIQHPLLFRFYIGCNFYERYHHHTGLP
jgi:hypothetical protein